MFRGAYEEMADRIQQLSLPDGIRVIAAAHNWEHNGLRDLTHLLRYFGHHHIENLPQILQKLPRDPRTLMKTCTIPPDSKEFHYIEDGLKNGIRMQLNSGYNFPDNKIRLEVNVDGIPVFKSPPTNFWPILCRVIGVNDHSPFLCGAYCGESKPKSVADFLNPLIRDINHLGETGIDHNGIHFRVELARVVCDVPARSFVKCTIGHSGI